MKRFLFCFYWYFGSMGLTLLINSHCLSNDFPDDALLWYIRGFIMGYNYASMSNFDDALAKWRLRIKHVRVITCFNSSRTSDAYMRQWNIPLLLQIMACRLARAKPLIIETNAGILLIGPSDTNFTEIFIRIYLFSFKKMHLQVSSRKWRPSLLGLNMIILLSCNHLCVLNLTLVQPM